MQKTRTHDVMRRRGILLEHVVRDDGDQDARDRSFCKRLYGRILQLAGVPRQVAGATTAVADGDGVAAEL